MAINAVVDGVTYSGITKVTAGGKEISLSESGGGGDLPAGIVEIKVGSWEQESDSSNDYTFNHGCGGTPEIIIISSNYKTRYTPTSKPANATLINEYWNSKQGIKEYQTVPATYDGSEGGENAPSGGALASTNDGFISSVDSSSVTINAAANRRIGGGLTYSWIAIRLAS